MTVSGCRFHVLKRSYLSIFYRILKYERMILFPTHGIPQLKVTSLPAEKFALFGNVTDCFRGDAGAHVALHEYISMENHIFGSGTHILEI